jgi:hypothetical protein
LDPRPTGEFRLSFLVAAALVFAGCLAVQYAGYDRLLATGLREPAVEARQRGLKRWLVFALAWQVLIIAGCFVYALVMTRTHRSGLAWIAPPLAALLGTALPYQLAASRLLRAVRQ